ncbi:MAG: hypothetical protein KBB11_06235 [Bacteroidales bacterium]|nr:hypothetical protein [Bacteroidales bacterium]HOY38156.1 hypothetical protein [Bacteroidales bacterium]HQP03054.1 hypothetical protein [Bacteroidales bacterium]
MKRFLISSFIVGFLIMLFNSCIKDNFDFDKWDGEVEWTPSFVAPVAWGDLSILEAIEAYDSTINLIANTDGYVSLLYYTNVSSRDISELIVIPDQAYFGVVNGTDIDFSEFDQNGEILSGTVNLKMGFTMFNEECEIDTIYVKSAILNSLVQSTYKHTLQLKFTFPTIVKNGSPLQIEYFYAPVGGIDANNDISLQGYHIDLTQTALGYNEVPVVMSYIFYHSGTPDNSGNIIFNHNFEDLEYEFMSGYFGYNSIIFETDSVNIGIFKNKNLNVDEYLFQDPKFKVRYHNSYGIPTNFFFTEMYARSKINDQNYNIIDYENGLPLDSLHPYFVNFPNIPWFMRDDSIVLNRFNSNIAQVISIQPKWIQFVAHAHTNPNGTSHTNFITDQSVLVADVEVELPLWGYIDNFHAADTSDFDFSEMYSTAQAIKRLAIRLDMTNGFPVEGYGQVYFMDENYTILDSLLYSYQERIIPAATIGSEGQVLEYAKKVTIVEITDDRVEKIKDAKYISYEGHSNSTEYYDDRLVKIYGEYRIKFDLSFEADIEMNVDIDTIEF